LRTDLFNYCQWFDFFLCLSLFLLYFSTYNLCLSNRFFTLNLSGSFYWVIYSNWVSFLYCNLFWFGRNGLIFNLFCLFYLSLFLLFIIICFLFDNIIFLPTLFRTFHPRSSSSSDCISIFVIWFSFFNNWLNSITMPRNNSLLWRGNIFLYSIFIDCLSFYRRFSNLTVSKCYWCFTWAIGDNTTWRRYISYVWVIILGMIRIRIVNILGFLSVLKRNIRSLFRYLNRLNLRRRNINIIYFVNVLLNLLFFFYYAFLNRLFLFWRFIILFNFKSFLTDLWKIFGNDYFPLLTLLGNLRNNIWI
jgi:hypothetical protein